MKINWKKLWEEFNKWHDVRDKCDKCGSVKFDQSKDWDDQRIKIQQLVSNQLKKK